MSPIYWLFMGAGFIAGASWPFRWRTAAGRSKRILRGLGAAVLVWAGLATAGQSAPQPWSRTVFQVHNASDLDAFYRDHAKGSAVLAFYSEGCPPCKASVASLNRLSRDGAAVAVVDADRHPSLADRYAVQMYPTTFFLGNGRITQTTVGYHSAAELQRSLNALRCDSTQ